MATEITTGKQIPRALFGALVLFGILWLMDFPKPMVDDLFYTGAGVNLAQGGDLANPLLARQAFPSHYFFVYPPLHSYLLGGWLKAGGVNALSMTAFTLLMYFIAAAAATIAILRRHAAPVWLEWLAPLGVSTSLLALGLRPEPVAIALTMAGFALFECGRKGPVSLLFAFLLMVMGASAAPRTMLFSTGLIFLATSQLWAMPAGQRSARLRLWTAAVAGALLAVLIFLAQIHFKAGEFWHSFHEHAQRVGGRRINVVIGFLNENPFLTNAQFPLVLLLAGLMVFAWQRWCDLTRIALVVALTFPVVAMGGGLGQGSLWYIVLMLLLYTAAVAKNQPGLERKLKVVVVLAFLVANADMLMIIWGTLGGKIRSSRGPDVGVAFEARTTAEHTILVDSSTARYVFDYKVPAGVLDIQFAAPFPKSHIVGEMRPGDIYVIGPPNVEVLKDATLLDVGIAKWVPFGLVNRHYYRYPCQAFVIPEENCHGLRAKYQMK